MRGKAARRVSEEEAAPFLHSASFPRQGPRQHHHRRRSERSVAGMSQRVSFRDECGEASCSANGRHGQTNGRLPATVYPPPVLPEGALLSEGFQSLAEECSDKETARVHDRLAPTESRSRSSSLFAPTRGGEESQRGVKVRPRLTDPLGESEMVLSFAREDMRRLDEDFKTMSKDSLGALSETSRSETPTRAPSLPMRDLRRMRRSRTQSIAHTANPVLQRFYRFCEETSFNGLNHVAHTHSRPFQCFWILCFFLSAIIVVILFGLTMMKYLSHPTGIDQEFLSEPVFLPPLSLCVPSMWLSNHTLTRLNLSLPLVRVIQWRLESQLLPNPVNYPSIVRDLEDTRREYDELLLRLNITNFYELLTLLEPKKTVRGREVSDTPKWDLLEANFMISDYDATGWTLFHCRLMTGRRVQRLFKRLTFNSLSEISTAGFHYVHRDALAYARVFYVISNFDLRTIMTVSPGTIYTVKYRQRTTRLLSTKDHPCYEAEATGSCQELCYQEVVDDSVEGCRSCQSQFHRLLHPRNLETLRPERGEHIDVEEAEEILAPLANATATLCDPWEWERCEHYQDHNKRVQLEQKHLRCRESCKERCTHVAHSYSYTIQKSEAVGGASEDLISTLIIAPEYGPQRNILIRQYPVMDIASVFSSFGGYLGLFLGSSVLTIVHVLAFSLRSTSSLICGLCRQRPKPLR